MNKDKITNKENNEIINKLYPNNDSSEKHNSKSEYQSNHKLNDGDESEKYIKEMHELADKNELKNNVIILCLGIVVVSIIAFSILMNMSFMKPKTDVANNKTTTTNSTDNSNTENSDTKSTDDATVASPQSPDKIYQYLNVEANRDSSLKKATTLNGGSKKGVTGYLLAEILRNNNYAIPESTCNVEQLLKTLLSMNWNKNTDFTKLEKGDICFTTDMPEKHGVPGHAYIFMGWVEDGKTDYAYVCDGQVDEYKSVLHKRNLSVATPQKDKFSYFVRK